MNTGEIILYSNNDGNINIDVLIADDTVWLSIDQMGELFQKSRATINEHIINIFEEKELEKEASLRKIGNSDFSTKPTNFYNLDVIISVGYRVKSPQGTQFRIWATQRLDVILQMNGRELLTHAGKISHEMALQKSTEEFDKFQANQRQQEKEQSMKELEEDIVRLQKKK